MLAVAGLASCSSNDNNLGGGEEEAVGRGYAKFTLSTDNLPTRAGSLTGSTDGEKKINNAKLYLAKANGIIEAVVDFEQTTPADPFTAVAEVASGSKIAVALVNIPSNINIVPGDNLSKLYSCKSSA